MTMARLDSIISTVSLATKSKLYGVTVATTEVEDSHAAFLNRTYRKIDKRILVWNVIMLTLIALETGNITNAAIMNKETSHDIKHQLGDLTDVQWAWILSVFNYPLVLLEPLSTVLVKRFTPRVWIGRIMITWGVVAMCVAASQNFAGLLSTRLLLGITEAGFIPSLLYHMSFWYPAKSLTFRVALVAGMRSFVMSISGLLAFAISYMNQVGGLAGWRWLFIIEGLPAIIAGIFTYWWLPNYPEDAKFLTPEERAAVVRNRPSRQPKATDSSWDWPQVRALLKRPSTYFFFAMMVGNAVGAKSIQIVLPTVLLELGITGSTHTQLMTIPPWIIGSIVVLLTAWAIQKKKLRSFETAGLVEIASLGCFIGLLFTQNPVARYILIVSALTLTIPIFALMFPERIGSVTGASATALATGLTACAGPFQGIVGPYVWLERFAPTYHVSIYISIGIIATTVFLIFFNKWLLKREGYIPVAERPDVEEDANEAIELESPGDDSSSGSKDVESVLPPSPANAVWPPRRSQDAVEGREVTV